MLGLRDRLTSCASRLQKWLGDRGFEKSLQGLEIGVSQGMTLDIDIRVFSTEDIEALLTILDKYEPDVAELAQAGEIPFPDGGGPKTRSVRRFRRAG
jgi:hypothetical protein